MDISFLILTLLNSYAVLFAASKLFNSKINYKNYKFYIILAFFTIYAFSMYQITQSFFRVLITLQVYILSNCFLHRKNNIKISKIMVVSLLSWILLGVCEVLSVIGIGILFELCGLELTDQLMGSDIPAIIIIFLYMLIFSDKKVQNILNGFLKKIYKLKIPKTFLTIVFVSTAFAMLLYSANFELSVTEKMLILFLVLIEYTLFLYTLLVEKYKTIELQEKIDTMITVTSEYEKMLEDNRINNHENKNQLIVIKDMIDSSNKEARDYIDEMIKNTYKEDSNLHLKVSKIPLGGLRGLIYYKLLTMKNNNIDFVMHIDKAIKIDTINKVDSELLQNFCKIVGVFLDNAIEAVENLKEKVIGIEIYLADDCFVLSVSNEYNTKIDFESLGKKSYSTKGENRGAGLKLVEKILKINKELINEKIVTGNLFTQKIKLRLK